MTIPKAPDGIPAPDLVPEPRGVRTVSKRIAAIGALLAVGFVGVLVYGQVRINQQNVDRAVAQEQQKTWNAAAGTDTTDGIPAGAAPLLSGKPPTPDSTGLQAQMPPAGAISLQAEAPPQYDALTRYRMAEQQQQQMPPPMSPQAPPAAKEDTEAAMLKAALIAPITLSKQAAQPAAQYGPAGASVRTPEATQQESGNTKLAFFDQSRKPTGRDTYLHNIRTPQMVAYEIKAGWEIPAVLEQQINSDLPGELKALVRQNVYDTASGHYLLIPQGSRLIGKYDSNVDYGQDGVQVVWDRIIFPDGSSISLDGMMGIDQHGNSGFRSDVDRHYKRTFGMAFLSSLFVAAYDLSQHHGNNNVGMYYPSAADTAAASVGREMSQTGQMITRKNMNVSPTIKIPIGYRFNVRVNRDIVFEGPYEPYDNTPAEPEPSTRKTASR